MLTYIVSRPGLTTRFVQVTGEQYTIYYGTMTEPSVPCFDGQQFVSSLHWFAAHMRQWLADGCTVIEGWES